MLNAQRFLPRVLCRAVSRPPFSRIVAGLPALTPFVAPEALERQRDGRALRLRLGANESPFGPSPKAIAAMQAAAESVQNYGDPESYMLRSWLACPLGLSVDNVVVGPGIDALLSLFARAYLDPGSAVVTTLGSYPTFEYGVRGAGGDIHRVPYRGDRVDLDALVEKVREMGARIVYLANPDNPSGSWHTPSDVAAFRRQLPDGCLLVLDEAYVDFAPETEGELDMDDPGVVVLRTFSKAHGMAGARIGYAIGDPVTVGVLDKIRMHFGVNAVAQAGAIASLFDPEHVQSVVEETARGREELATAMRGLGLRALPSATNFLTVDVGSPERAKAILSALLEDDVFIRMPVAPPLDRCIRVTIGTADQRRQFVEALTAVLGGTPD
jgi:histidinol-phosphate aminotransferase